MTDRPRERYIRHLTLDTGDQRDSYRHEVADDVIALLRPRLERAVAGEEVAVPGTGCVFTAAAGRARSLLVTVWGPPAVGQRVPLVTFGVAPNSLASDVLWQTWIGCERDDRTPAPPWCVVRILPGLAVYPQAAHWLGDFERCVAWAHLEKPDA